MGKESAARKYFVKANPLRPGQPEKRPYLDIFTKDSDNPVFHGKDITVNHGRGWTGSTRRRLVAAHGGGA